MVATATPLACWSMLIRHARNDVSTLRLQDLCRDEDRVASLVTVYNTAYHQSLSNNSSDTAASSSSSSSVHDYHHQYHGTNSSPAYEDCNSPNNLPTITENRTWILDLSRQQMTDMTLNHLLRLADAVKLREFITQLAWGQNNPKNPIVPIRCRRKSPTSIPQASSTGSSSSTNNASTSSPKHYKSFWPKYYHQSHQNKKQQQQQQQTQGQRQSQQKKSSSTQHQQRHSRWMDVHWVEPTLEKTWEEINLKRLARAEAASKAAAAVAENEKKMKSWKVDQNLKHTDVEKTTSLGEDVNDISNGMEDDTYTDEIKKMMATTASTVVSNTQRTSTSKKSTINDYTICPSMHMAMRVPMQKGYEMITLDGNNALVGIHNEWHRIERISDTIRNGQYMKNINTTTNAFSGSSSPMVFDVVVVGMGVSIKALQFVYNALCHDEKAVRGSMLNMPLMQNNTAADVTLSTAANRLLTTVAGSASSILHGGNNALHSGTSNTSSNNSKATFPRRRKRRMRFVTTIDPIAALHVVSDLEPASTLIVSIALSGSEETSAATKALKSWLLQSLGSSSSSSGTAFPTGANTAPSSSNSATQGTSIPTAVRTDHILSKHMILITGNDRIATVTNKPESVYVIPSHSRCEAFCNFSAITLLPLSIVFGWDVVQDFLRGGHDLDLHFVNEKPRHNIPVLLAMTDVWNTLYTEQQTQSNVLNLRPKTSSSIRAIMPFTEALKYYPVFVGALEAQVCSGTENIDPHSRMSTLFDPHPARISSMIVDCGLDGSYDRALYNNGGHSIGLVGSGYLRSANGNNVMNSELIMVMDTQVPFQTTAVSSSSNQHPSTFAPFSTGANRFYNLNTSSHGKNQQQQQQQQQQQRRLEEDIQSTQDAMMCSLLAHADELAFGPAHDQSMIHNNTRHFVSMSSSMSQDPVMNSFTGGSRDLSPTGGNRPSIILLSTKLDAFACGQLLALCEHRAAVKARLWGLDPFDAKQQVGSAPRMERTDLLQVELHKLLLSNNDSNSNINNRTYPNTHNELYNSDGEGVEVQDKPLLSDPDEDEETDNPNNIILSTKTILELYATVIKKERNDK